MNNYEKHQESIDPMLQRGEHVALNKDTKEIVSCRKLECENCMFSRRYNWPYDCTLNRTKWLVEECNNTEVDWSRIPSDTPIFVSNDGKNWKRRYFVRKTAENMFCVYSNGATSWSSNGRVSLYKYGKL